MTVKVDTYPGIAFHEPDLCDVEDHHAACRIVVMVGDDYKHHVDMDDVHEIDDDDYCSGCGQIGCGW